MKTVNLKVDIHLSVKARDLLEIQSHMDLLQKEASFIQDKETEVEDQAITEETKLKREVVVDAISEEITVIEGQKQGKSITNNQLIA